MPVQYDTEAESLAGVHLGAVGVRGHHVTCSIIKCSRDNEILQENLNKTADLARAGLEPKIIQTHLP